jgi:Rrf2 family transcriptional regulator, nitric oxide-sensitive transcriptional repressor
MNRLNRKVEYALMALRVIANKRQGERTSAKEVVDETGCPFDATARVLQQLAQKGILQSEQGVHGGYLLRRDLGRLSLHELNETILGPLAIARCLDDDQGGRCELTQTCNVISPVTLLNRKLVEFYKSVRIGDLLRVKDHDLREETGTR